jgi:hypothetical protein
MTHQLKGIKKEKRLKINPRRLPYMNPILVNKINMKIRNLQEKRKLDILSQNNFIPLEE